MFLGRILSLLVEVGNMVLLLLPLLYNWLFSISPEKSPLSGLISAQSHLEDILASPVTDHVWAYFNLPTSMGGLGL